MKGPRRIGDIVANHSVLQLLVTKTTELKGLRDTLAVKLGDSFVQNFDVAALHDDGTLVLIAQSPAWATRLRYVVPDLLVWARAVPSLTRVTDIQVQLARVRRPQGNP